MARKARVKSSTGKYIILLRGIEDSVFHLKKSKDLFYDTAKEYLGENMLGIRFFADRVVILVKESDKGISMDLKPVLIKFARAYNKDRYVQGKVFADRFKSLPVENSEFEKQCVDYIDGKKVKDPFESKTVSVKKTEKPVENKPVQPEPEIKPIPKKRNDMPTWLL